MCIDNLVDCLFATTNSVVLILGSTITGLTIATFITPTCQPQSVKAEFSELIYLTIFLCCLGVTSIVSSILTWILLCFTKKQFLKWVQCYSFLTMIADTTLGGVLLYSWYQINKWAWNNETCKGICLLSFNAMKNKLSSTEFNTPPVSFERRLNRNLVDFSQTEIHKLRPNQMQGARTQSTTGIRSPSASNHLVSRAARNAVRSNSRMNWTLQHNDEKKKRDNFVRPQYRRDLPSRSRESILYRSRESLPSRSRESIPFKTESTQTITKSTQGLYNIQRQPSKSNYEVTSSSLPNISSTPKRTRRNIQDTSERHKENRNLDYRSTDALLRASSESMGIPQGIPVLVPTYV